MILDPWILESIDQAEQEALVLPESERERHHLAKASELQREALIAGRSLQETQDIGSTFVDGTRVLVRYRHISDVLARLPTQRADRIDELLPNRWTPAASHH